MNCYLIARFTTWQKGAGGLSERSDEIKTLEFVTEMELIRYLQSADWTLAQKEFIGAFQGYNLTLKDL